MARLAFVIAGAIVAVTLAAGPAVAQQLPPPQQQPPPVLVPCVPTVTPAEIDGLERDGRHKKLAGVVLMSTGGGLVAAGTALALAAWAHDDRASCYRYNGYYGYGYNSGWCGDRSLAIAGGTTMVIGFGALFTGVPVYLIGSSQVARARRLRSFFGIR